MKRYSRFLFEQKLSREDVQNNTKEWFAIKNGEGQYQGTSEAEKRQAFDRLYDKATRQFFKEVPVMTDQKAKEAMRKLWLQVGFEAADGTDPKMNLAYNVLKLRTSKLAAPILNFTLSSAMSNDMIQAIEKHPELAAFLGRSKDFYTYAPEDMVKGFKTYNEMLKAVDKETDIKKRRSLQDKVNQIIFKQGDPQQQRGPLTNMRSWQSEAKALGLLNKDRKQDDDLDFGDEETIQIKKLPQQRKAQDIINFLKAGGFDWKNAADLDLLKTIETKARAGLN